MEISVTILTKNAERSLRATLDSLKLFKEVLILDTGSTDRTLQIAAEFPNVTIKSSPFLGFGKSHNLATSLARYDWILSVDSDEVLSEELIEEISTLKLDPQSVYLVPRHNYFNQKKIRGCSGWHSDRVVRLYHRNHAAFSDAAVHEKIVSTCPEVALSSPLHHTPYLEIADFLAKMQTYTTLFAEQEKEKKEGSFSKALFHSWFTFFKSYILNRGFLAGKEGFIISAYQSQTAFYKYLKLEELRFESRKGLE